MKTFCNIDGCSKPAVTRGWCLSHYQRFWKYGNPLGGKTKGPPNDALAWLNNHVNYDDSECLIWPFSLSPRGYGLVHINGWPYRANRIMCEKHHGKPPSRKHHAAHSCGNNACVNPKHVRWATPAENEADKIIHGRTTRGSANGRAKLTEQDVLAIRSAGKEVFHKTLAALYGVSDTLICDIRNYKVWAYPQKREIEAEEMDT